MRVKYNFANIRSTPGYVPRLADDRVGFWQNPHLNFNRDDRYDNIARYIMRWNLQASDASKPSPAKSRSSIRSRTRFRPSIGRRSAKRSSSGSHDFLKSIVLHEVGHDIGLAHNFIGDDAYSADQLKSKRFTDAYGVTSSAMECAPVNLWPRNASHGGYFQLVPGSYDYHVIHWGYAPVPGATTAESEVPTLDRWAASATDPKYAFASDEDVESNGHAVDPRIAQFLLTKDDMA